MQNGNQKGFKKIMVLYETTKKGSKPNKCNWVMHQFHLGTDEDEREGEYVVSKISYQPQKETDKNETNLNPEESDIGTTHGSPKTPKTNTPFRPKPVKTPDAVSDKGIIPSPLQVGGNILIANLLAVWIVELAISSCRNFLFEIDAQDTCWMQHADS